MQLPPYRHENNKHTKIMLSTESFRLRDEVWGGFWFPFEDLVEGIAGHLKEGFQGCSGSVESATSGKAGGLAEG